MASVGFGNDPIVSDRDYNDSIYQKSVGNAI
jgi:hypothetical protein